MSVGDSQGPRGHNGEHLGGNQDVLVALVGVNQNSFEHLACLLEALGAQGQAQGPQNGAKGTAKEIGEARYLCPGKKA